jgi:O-methyltransferase involved in polyketide biosynthesis
MGYSSGGSEVVTRKMNMSETTYQDLSGVTETLLMILAIRAFESQRPDALIKDERAEALVSQMDQDFLRNKLAKVEDYSQVAMILRSRDCDCHAQDFLARHPDAVVVHIGCGLDTRFERVDNGKVEWYDLDLLDVIALRRRLIGGEGERYHLLGCSVLDNAWLDAVNEHRQRPFLFLAEGVFMYFTKTQVKSLVLTMKEHFPDAELVFDAFSPFLSLANNFRVTLTKVGARSHWALKDGKDLEKWSDGIRLLDERFPYQYPEPRLGRALAVRHNPFFARAIGVFHYQL